MIGSSGSEPRRPLGIVPCLWWMLMILDVLVTVRLALSMWMPAFSGVLVVVSPLLLLVAMLPWIVCVVVWLFLWMVVIVSSAFGPASCRETSLYCVSRTVW